VQGGEETSGRLPWGEEDEGRGEGWGAKAMGKSCLSLVWDR